MLAILHKEPQGDLQGRLDSVAAGAGTNTVSVAFFPREPWAIRMEKRTAAVFAYIWTVHFLQQTEIRSKFLQATKIQPV